MERGTNYVPKHTHRLFLSVNLAIGPRAEPEVSNRSFLGSFLDIGVWIRVANAAAHLEILRAPKSSETQRLAAVAGFYQEAGLQAEDAVSNLIAWAVWAKDRNACLADLMDRISLRFSPPRGPTADHYHEVGKHFRIPVIPKVS